MFWFSPIDGKADFSTSIVLNKDGMEEKGTRVISFLADFSTPHKIYVSNGAVYDLRDHEDFPVSVNIHEPDLDSQKESKTPPCFFGLGGSSIIHLTLQKIRFDDILQAIRTGEKINFNISPPGHVWLQHNDYPPPALDNMRVGTDGPRLEQHELFWNTDASPVIEIRYVEYRIGITPHKEPVSIA